MPRAPRQMQLTAHHVSRVHREIADPGVQAMPGFRNSTDEDYAAIVGEVMASRPAGPFWLFGYGSLIWKPETAFLESQVALARGWHRRFCLGWDYRFRGSRDTPGLMMALDRGGQCRGVAYRLPEETLEAELHKLMRREVSMVPSAFPWRWVDLVAADGPLRALTFAMNRKSGRYIAHLSDHELADVLARAVGFRGSMAEYLFSTVSKLEELGIHDRNLWRLQALVADRIDAAHTREH
ncbi:MAG: gamma-glutamylcyclotransferase [Devosia nanyangense]|uniref:glutathione-specific gamma-glutamylcyclotransferase n=1 Tax=Devosia nanyangense TaxID=1228055 RepID=A0A933L4F8_9HYPH|nr:gamma-glutamylcyclotransferase [Devosia nanyangense]